MPYLINHYSGSQLALVVDGTVDQSTPLKIIGKNYVGYGEAQNENFVWLLENFANPTAPTEPLPGQFWYNSSLKTINLYDGTTWRQISTSQISTEKIRDVSSNIKTIIKIFVDDTVVAVVSKTSFTILAQDAIPGFSTLVAGITLCDQFIVKGNIEGIADSAKKLDSAVKINNVDFDGTDDITILAVTPFALIPGTGLLGSNFTGASAVTLTVDSASANTPSKVVARNASGDFSAGNITASLTGNASTATTFQTARTINGVSFNGSANITIYDSSKLPLSGGTMTGQLQLNEHPTYDLQAATKKYVDDSVGSITVIPQGLISMWSGSIASIPSGWALCNGQTIGLVTLPDLRNKFIVGAGSTYNVAATGGTAHAVVVNHAHTGSFTGNAMPNHDHNITDSGHVHGSVLQAAANPLGRRVTLNRAVGQNAEDATGGNLGTVTASAETGITINSKSAGTPAGSISVDAAGSSDGVNANLPPYYALAYIMKL